MDVVVVVFCHNRRSLSCGVDDVVNDALVVELRSFLSEVILHALGVAFIRGLLCHRSDGVHDLLWNDLGVGDGVHRRVVSVLVDFSLQSRVAHVELFLLDHFVSDSWLHLLCDSRIIVIGVFASSRQSWLLT